MYCVWEKRVAIGQKIETKEAVKDLGIFISNDGMFQHQINKIIEKAKNIVSWILQTFTSRSATAMTTHYKSLAIPNLEYCSILWSPNTVGFIQKIEEIQKSFLKKINGAPENYWVCLKDMKIYSLQRRRERYRIMYVWKVLKDLVPNPNN